MTREQKVAAPLLPLEGTAARMWWRSSPEDGRDGAGDWWSGVLRPSRLTPGQAGTFALHYTQDLQVDELAVFVQPDGRCVVRRVEPLPLPEPEPYPYPYPYPYPSP